MVCDCACSGKWSGHGQLGAGATHHRHPLFVKYSCCWPVICLLYTSHACERVVIYTLVIFVRADYIKNFILILILLEVSV